MAFNPNIPTWGNVAETDITAIRVALNALRAIETSATAPASPVAHMLWADTSTGQLRQRNPANTAWIRRWSLSAEETMAPPPGLIEAYAMQAVPTGRLACNGAAVSRTTFAALFAAIGTTWGAGDGTTTFNVPDLRGEFLRGWDAGRGIDPGRAFATLQSSDFAVHAHSTAVVVGQGGATPGGWMFDIPGAGMTGEAGGTETRPRNRAIQYCIVF